MDWMRLDKDVRMPLINYKDSNLIALQSMFVATIGN